MSTIRRSCSRSEAKTGIQSLISECSFYMPTSEEFTQRVLDLRKRFNLPSYYWNYLEGYADRQRDVWAMTRQVYCVAFEPFKPVPMNWNDITEEQRELLRTGNDKRLMKGFYWKHYQTGELTDKIWFARTDEASDAEWEARKLTQQSIAP